MAPPQSTSPQVCRICNLTLPREMFEPKYRTDATKRRSGYQRECRECRAKMLEKQTLPRYDVDPETGCWVWRGCKRNGYGFARKDHRNVMAHRRMYELHVGPIHEGMQLDHLCRNRACVNPEHLEVVTQTVNIRRGASAKLSMETAYAIRQRYAEGGITAYQLAEQYGVVATCIYKVISGHTWKHEDYS